MKQRGFTLIELIVVIVILGILAAVALPRFIDLTDEALTASAAGVAGAVSSATAINYGAFQANSAKTGVQRLDQANVCDVAVLGPLMQSGSTTSLVANSGVPAIQSRVWAAAPARPVRSCPARLTKDAAI